MGSGIAEVSAAHGLHVVVRELSADLAAAAHERVERSVARAVGAGKLTQDAADEALGRITFTDDILELAGADLVIEAVPEDVTPKKAVLAAAAEVVADDTLIASNTSSIPIAQLASAVPNAQRVLGLHFFSPVPVMRLVEIVLALDTSEEARRRATDYVAAIGKSAIETKDRSGFIVNMLLVPYLMAGVRMYEEGFATREHIDEGMRLGCGHPMGPLTLCDFIGLDVCYAVCESLYDEFKRPEYAPPPLLKRMVASGRLGRKSGHGFYEYAQTPIPVAK
jgi:3-hydroxybutyryl-CoA dehydrogenase